MDISLRGIPSAVLSALDSAFAKGKFQYTLSLFASVKRCLPNCFIARGSTFSLPDILLFSADKIVGADITVGLRQFSCLIFHIWKTESRLETTHDGDSSAAAAVELDRYKWQ